MRDKYKLYLRETEFVEEESWKVAKRYPSKAELEMDLGSLPETKSGKARGGAATPIWVFAMAFPLLAIEYLACLLLWAIFGLWKWVSTSLAEAWKMMAQSVRLFEQWRYDRAKAKKEKENAKL